jgi:hypothetical protein
MAHDHGEPVPLAADEVLGGDEHVVEVERAAPDRLLPHVGEPEGGYAAAVGLDEERADPR